MTHKTNTPAPAMQEAVSDADLLRICQKFNPGQDFDLAKAVRAEVLSKLRAPVADERAAQEYGSPADVAQRIEQYLAHDGRMNSGTQLLYEAMKALRSLARGSK